MSTAIPARHSGGSRRSSGPGPAGGCSGPPAPRGPPARPVEHQRDRAATRAPDDAVQASQLGAVRTHRAVQPVSGPACGTSAEWKRSDPNADWRHWKKHDPSAPRAIARSESSRVWPGVLASCGRAGHRAHRLLHHNHGAPPASPRMRSCARAAAPASRRRPGPRRCRPRRRRPASPTASSRSDGRTHEVRRHADPRGRRAHQSRCSVYRRAAGRTRTGESPASAWVHVVRRGARRDDLGPVAVALAPERGAHARFSSSSVPYRARSQVWNCAPHWSQ